MKKILLFMIFPLLFGLLGALLLECIILGLSILVSPFAAIDEKPFLIFVLSISLLTILLIAAMVFFYVKYLFNLGCQGNIKKVIVIQTFISAVSFSAFLTLYEWLFKLVYEMF